MSIFGGDEAKVMKYLLNHHEVAGEYWMQYDRDIRTMTDFERYEDKNLIKAGIRDPMDTILRLVDQGYILDFAYLPDDPKLLVTPKGRRYFITRNRERFKVVVQDILIPLVIAFATTVITNLAFFS